MRKTLLVKVPATSGNLGPGFDVLGVALNFYNELYVKQIGGTSSIPIIDVRGEGELSVPRDHRNVIYQSFVRVFKEARCAVPRVEMLCINNIPLARGLGSSSAAIVSGLLAANQFLKQPFSMDRILDWASEEEGHPDNVAPAIFGGVQACLYENGHVVRCRWKEPLVNVVVAIPEFELPTKKARSVLPAKISMSAAVKNLASVALLQDALSMQTSRLKVLLDDRWHEPYRSKLIPGFYAVKKSALKAGALGVILSGAGPTMLSFVPKNSSVAERVGKAMLNAFGRAGVKCSIKKLDINRKGSIVK